MHIKADTLDDLMRRVLNKILRFGSPHTASKGSMRELVSVLLTLENPRARFSRTESRATLFSCLGEALWHLSGSESLVFIEYYIQNYRTFAEIPDHLVISDGAYGPRLFGPSCDNLHKVIDLLKNKPGSRRAVVQIFANSDRTNYDTPCTCTLQFFARGGTLHMLTNMRSNDAFIGLPHDIFAFTMIQELVARSIGHDVGRYCHAVGSLHLYDDNEAQARRYLSEDWQDTIAMPQMPQGDPWSSVCWLLQVESSIRAGHVQLPSHDCIDQYWVDLARLLLIKAFLGKNEKRSAINEGKSMSSKVYDTFLRRKLGAQKDMGKEAQLSLPGLQN